MRGPAWIEGSVLPDARLRRDQNRTIAYAWRRLLQGKSPSFLISDAVGRGKSYMALALAMGLWRRSRKRRFKILILASSRELTSAWLDKLIGPDRGTGLSRNIMAPDRGESYFAHYLEEFRKNRVKVAAYGVRTFTDAKRVDRARHHEELKRICPGMMRGTSIEVLVTSPGFLTRTGTARGWRNWASSADVVIADEIYEARNAKTLYGRLLSPHVKASSRIFRKNRPWLIALSATLLSRDMTDTRRVIELLIKWSCRRPQLDARTHALVDDLDVKCGNYNRDLSEALKGTAPTRAQKAAYKLSRVGLERILLRYMSRIPASHQREYQLWTTHASRLPMTPALSTQNFPFAEGEVKLSDADMISSLDGPGLEKDLATFLRSARRYGGTKGVGPRQYHNWLALTELEPAHQANGRDILVPGVKRRTIDQWLIEHLGSITANSKNPGRPTFKVVIYTQHVKTAKSFTSRGTTSDLNLKLKAPLRRAWRSLAKRERILFPRGLYTHRSRIFDAALEREQYTSTFMKELSSRDPTLLIAAILNALGKSSERGKIRAFLRTLGTKKRYAAQPPILRRLKLNPGLRARVLDYVDCGQLAAKTQAASSTDRRAMMWTVFDNPYVAEVLSDVQLPAELRPLVETIGSLDMRQKKVRQLIEIVGDALLKDRNTSYYLWRWNASLPRLERYYERRKLESESRARSSRPVEVLTGDNPERRVPVSKDFLSPGNPFVLVLTNVCRMGVDLHNYCWDVVHYSPSWTPSDFEQKSGRIDRPRPRGVKEGLDLGFTKTSNYIRIHHLIWPLTYDERILRRMNLRAHYSERLLASKLAESDATNDVTRFKHLPALKLAPPRKSESLKRHVKISPTRTGLML